MGRTLQARRERKRCSCLVILRMSAIGLRWRSPLRWSLPLVDNALQEQVPLCTKVTRSPDFRKIAYLLPHVHSVRHSRECTPRIRSARRRFGMPILVVLAGLLTRLRLSPVGRIRGRVVDMSEMAHLAEVDGDLSVDPDYTAERTLAQTRVVPLPIELRNNTRTLPTLLRSHRLRRRRAETRRTSIYRTPRAGSLMACSA